MAATTLRPTINIKSSFTTIGAGFKKANKSVGSIRTILLKRTKVKRDAIAGKRNLFSKRIENQRRKDSEAVVEASKIGILPTHAINYSETQDECMSAYRSVGNVVNRQKSCFETAFTQAERNESYNVTTPEPSARKNEPPPLTRQKNIRSYTS
jgi:hypothetical protein